MRVGYVSYAREHYSEFADCMLCLRRLILERRKYVVVLLLLLGGEQGLGGFQ